MYSVKFIIVFIIQGKKDILRTSRKKKNRKRTNERCVFFKRDIINIWHFSAFRIFKCQHRNTYLLYSIQVYLMSKIRNYFRNICCFHSVSCCKCNGYLIQKKTELLDIVIPMSTNCEVPPTALINNGILFRAHSINLILYRFILILNKSPFQNSLLTSFGS